MQSIVWFRNDLRLSDSPALWHAVKESSSVIFLYIDDPTTSLQLGGAQRWWLHHSLCSLQKSLEKRNVYLVLKQGKSVDILKELVKRHHIEAIYWNQCFEPELKRRDETIEAYFCKNEVAVKKFNAYLLTNPEKITNKSGGVFKVYTPYWKKINSLLTRKDQFSIPRNMKTIKGVSSDRLEDWDLLPKKPDWSAGLVKSWKVGELAAQRALKKFIEERLEDYVAHRDRPDMNGTSRLSPYLHFGELSVGQVWNAVKEAKHSQPRFSQGATKMLQQLVWREFSYYLLTHFPKLDKENFRDNFNRFRWAKSKKLLKAWQNGLTGYPIVDAGMRELWETGYMHNRVRMIVASFLTKDLFIHWREGEAWFWDTLVDADLANNAASWQWVAGSGADAAPYFRIFNPVLQGEKFDPNGDYVRKWIPELSALPNKFIHQPWKTPEEILQQEGINLGKDYPEPIVDHKQSRDEALRRYKEIK